MPSAINTLEKQRHRKRLIVGCDGSWQSSDRPTGNVSSNVTNICRSLTKEARLSNGEAVQQVVYYQSGIGTHFLSAVPSQLGTVAGKELGQNVVEAYNFLCSNYEFGDEICLFGFSRGAYTARALAGMVCSVGIIKKGYMVHFPKIYAKYKENENVEALVNSIDEEGANTFKQIYGSVEGWDGIHEAYGNHTPALRTKYGGDNPPMVEIKVIGVWDTVGSLGFPDTWLDEYHIADPIKKWDNKGYKYIDIKLSDRVKNAFHAIALDERRRPFSPTLWHKPIENKNTTLLQCWFPGAHINSGGGTNSQKGDLNQLSDLAFAWMVDLCQPYLAFDSDFLDRFAAVHHLRAKELRKRAKKETPSYTPDPTLPAWADPKVGNIIDSFDSVPFYGSRIRAPGEYDLENAYAEVGSQKWNEKFDKFVTNEYIHPSVRIRLENTKKLWKPDLKTGEIPWSSPVQQRALRHFTFGKAQIDPTRPKEDVFDDPGKGERHLTREGTGGVWTKTANGAKLIISEWKVAPEKLSKQGFVSFEKRLLFESESTNNTIAVNRYEKVWNDIQTPPEGLHLPPAEDPSLAYQKLAAGGAIVCKTTWNIGTSLFGVIAWGPKKVYNAAFGVEETGKS